LKKKHKAVTDTTSTTILVTIVDDDEWSATALKDFAIRRALAAEIFSSAADCSVQTFSDRRVALIVDVHMPS